MSRNSWRDISTRRPRGTGKQSTESNGGADSSSGSTPFLGKEYIKYRLRSAKADRNGTRLKKSARCLNTVGIPGLCLVATIAFAAICVSAEQSVLKVVYGITGPVFMIGAATLSDFSDDDKSEKADGVDEGIGGIGVRYARVSSNRQKEEGNSIDAQKESLKKLAAKHNIELPFEPIVDEGKTGTDFDREGIKKVMTYARDGEINSLLVVNLSRVGREAPKTLCFIYLLQEMWNVSIVTPKGVRDLSNAEDLMTTTLRALIDHLSYQNRTTQCLESTIHNFNAKNWSSGFGDNIPYGYRPTEDGWIKKVDQMEDAVNDLFNHFLSSRNYADTGRYMEKNHDMALPKNKGDRIKDILTRGVYVGQPRIDIDSDLLDYGEAVVTDPDLEMVQDGLYEGIQRIVKRKEDKNSTGETFDPDDFAEEFGLRAVFESDPYLKLHCPECDTVMKKNGQATLADGMVDADGHHYKCKDTDNCGREYKFPNVGVLGEIERLSEVFSEEEGSWVRDQDT